MPWMIFYQQSAADKKLRPEHFRVRGGYGHWRLLTQMVMARC
jgi:hypothetical protein